MAEEGAPDRIIDEAVGAGKGLANPLGAIWSASLMLEHLGETDAASRLHARDRGGLQARARGPETSAAPVRRPRSATPWRPMSDRALVADAVFYQIYVRSFADSDGDGVGDLPGIRSRLPYLQRARRRRDLADAVLPLAAAPTTATTSPTTATSTRSSARSPTSTRCVADAHELGLRVTIDIVPNHTSDQHPWFRNALADPTHPDRQRYVFRPRTERRAAERTGRPSSAAPPGRSTSRRGEWYLHLFAPEQPDLDWHNEAVQDEFEQILRFWLDRGVDGFRIDVAHALFKEQDLPRRGRADAASAVRATGSRPLDQPELHPLYRRWRRIADEYPGERMFVGEIVIENQETIASYVERRRAAPRRSTSRCCSSRGTRSAMRRRSRTLAALGAVGAPPTWVLENHDVTRLATRYGGGERRPAARRARRRSCSSACRARRTSTRARSSGSRRSTSRRGAPGPDLLPDQRATDRPRRLPCADPVDPEPPTFGFTTGEPWLPMPAGLGCRERRGANRRAARPLSSCTARGCGCGLTARISPGATVPTGR